MDFAEIEDPITDKERADVASTCVDDLELPMPALIDGVDDKVNMAYSGWPDRLYLVGKDGKIAYAGGRGPFGFDPDSWEKAIVAEKAKNAQAPTTKGSKAKDQDGPAKKIIR